MGWKSLAHRVFFSTLNPNLPSDLLTDHSRHTALRIWWFQLIFTVTSIATVLWIFFLIYPFMEFLSFPTGINGRNAVVFDLSQLLLDVGGCVITIWNFHPLIDKLILYAGSTRRKSQQHRTGRARRVRCHCYICQIAEDICRWHHSPKNCRGWYSNIIHCC